MQSKSGRPWSSSSARSEGSNQKSVNCAGASRRSELPAPGLYIQWIRLTCCVPPGGEGERSSGHLPDRGRAKPMRSLTRPAAGCCMRLNSHDPDNRKEDYEPLPDGFESLRCPCRTWMVPDAAACTGAGRPLRARPTAAHRSALLRSDPQVHHGPAVSFAAGQLSACLEDRAHAGEGVGRCLWRAGYAALRRGRVQVLPHA